MVISDPISVQDSILNLRRDRGDRGSLKYCICTIFLFPVLSLSESGEHSRPKRAQKTTVRQQARTMNLNCEALTPIRMIAIAPVLSSYSQRHMFSIRGSSKHCIQIGRAEVIFFFDIF